MPLVRDNSRGEAQIVSYVVSGIGFLGAGVIFKDSGSVRGLNTAATIWCWAFCSRWRIAFNPAQVTGKEQEVTYGFEPICRPEDEARMRALLLQAMSRSSLTLTGLRSEDVEGTPKMRVTAQIKGLGRQDEALEQLVVRLSLEAGVSSVSWAVHPQVIESFSTPRFISDFLIPTAVKKVLTGYPGRYILTDAGLGFSPAFSMKKGGPLHMFDGGSSRMREKSIETESAEPPLLESSCLFAL